MDNKYNRVQTDLGYHQPHETKRSDYPTASTVRQASKKISPRESPLKEWWLSEQEKKS